MAISNEQGNIVERRSYDAWGRHRHPTTWNYLVANPFGMGGSNDITLRGYTFHEHLPHFSLINMNGRLYDYVMGRMLSPDNYVQSPDNTQSFNRYAYCWNNPLKYSDPTGEIVWFVPIIIGAAIFGTGNLAIQASNGNVNSWGDGFKAFGAGAIVGAVAGATWSFGLAALNGTALVGGKTVISGIALKSGLAKAAAWTVLGGKSVSTLSTITSGISDPENAFKIALGKTYLDENRTFLGQTWQGISRYTWEGLQTFVGYNYSQFRNTFGGVNRVDYFGGATFSTSENRDSRWGVSIGNQINLSIWDEINEPFQDRVLRDPLFMHEYGHTFDSQIFGISYLFAVGIPSASGASWTEYRANHHAERYFRKRYGVDWTPHLSNYPLRKP